MEAHKYLIETEETLTPREVAEQLMNSRLAADERIGEVRLECGCDLEVDIETIVEDDPRCDGYLDHTETFTLSDIREEFTECEFYVWAKDEDGDDVLLCLN